MAGTLHDDGVTELDARATRPVHRVRERLEHRELLGRDTARPVEPREVAAAQPDRLDAQHCSTGRRFGFRELAHLPRAVAVEHAGAHGAHDGALPARRTGIQWYGDSSSPAAADCF